MWQKKMYSEETRRTMYKCECGFILHPYATHLGASPDGVVLDEEKIKEAAKIKNFCLGLDRNAQTYLKIVNYYLLVRY